MDNIGVRVMSGAAVGSFSQWGVEVHRATARPSLASHHHRGACAAHCTVEVLKCVAMRMGFASEVHDGDAGTVTIIVDANLVAGAAVWWRVAARRARRHPGCVAASQHAMSEHAQQAFAELAMAMAEGGPYAIVFHAHVMHPWDQGKTLSMAGALLCVRLGRVGESLVAPGRRRAPGTTHRRLARARAHGGDAALG